MTIHPSALTPVSHCRAATTLWILLAAFVLRVVAQPVSATGAVEFLPAFETWHSGVLPYALLVCVQLILIASMCVLAWRIGRRPVAPRPRLGKGLRVVGGAYLLVMLSRLFLGASLFADSTWFTRWLPTVFHCVLAGFLLVAGTIYMRGTTHDEPR